MKIAAPKEDEKYFFITMLGGQCVVYHKVYDSTHQDLLFRATGNFFSRREDAEKAIPMYRKYIMTKEPDTSWREGIGGDDYRICKSFER